MRRFWVPSDRIREACPVLDGEEARHLIQVLRAKIGQGILLMDGMGTLAEAEIRHIHRDRVDLIVLRRRVVSKEDPFRLVVAQALLKEAYMEDLIRRWVELGVDECIPFVSERSVPVLNGDRGRKRKHRWETLAKEAMKQSGNPWLPVLHEPVDFDRMVDALRACTVKLLFYENESRRIDRNLFPRMGREAGMNIGVVFGPEGGFSETEAAALQRSGFVSVSLGSRILRAVTAEIVGLGLIGFLAKEAMTSADNLF